ncbi:MAG TPA: hypothetical protein VK815_18035 [Candidatus Acidoferrales bacterium]|jgi:hypothetical protein|nr:hypothetical protein [Candidatus Acidoferrales bacterium]
MGSVTLPLDLKQYIGPEEILTSSQLVERVTANKMAPPSARQLIRRNSEAQGIWRSQHLVLPGGGRLFCHAGFRRNDRFFTTILPVLDEFRPGIARLVRAVMAESVVLYPRAEQLLASPVIPDNSSYPYSGHDIDALTELGLGRLEADDSVLKRFSADSLDLATSHALAIRSNARFLAEVALARILFEQLRHQNVISWNKKAMPDKAASLVSFNNFLFSATGFSWLRPMLRFNKSEKPKATPAVLDVIAKLCEVYDVDSFAERIQRAGQNKNSKLAILGIIAAFDFTKAAWKKAKAEGYVAINLRQHFGDAAFEALVVVQEILKNVAGEPAKAKDEDYQKLADTLEQLKCNPYVVDLRSLGFESVSGLLLRTKGYENVQLNLKVAHDSGEEREVDVCGDRNGRSELFVVECKAESSNKMLAGEFVQKFYTETVPAYLKSMSAGGPKECRAEIWTTGQVGDEAKSALSQIKMSALIKPAMLGHEDVKSLVPKSLGSCKRLLEAISAH